MSIFLRKFIKVYFTFFYYYFCFCYHMPKSMLRFLFTHMQPFSNAHIHLLYVALTHTHTHTHIAIRRKMCGGKITWEKDTQKKIMNLFFRVSMFTCKSWVSPVPCRHDPLQYCNTKKTSVGKQVLCALFNKSGGVVSPSRWFLFMFRKWETKKAGGAAASDNWCDAGIICNALPTISVCNWNIITNQANYKYQLHYFP